MMVQVTHIFNKVDGCWRFNYVTLNEILTCTLGGGGILVSGRDYTYIIGVMVIGSNLEIYSNINLF